MKLKKHFILQSTMITKRDNYFISFLCNSLVLHDKLFSKRVFCNVLPKFHAGSTIKFHVVFQGLDVLSMMMEQPNLSTLRKREESGFNIIERIT